jgi:hypothetical protein
LNLLSDLFLQIDVGHAFNHDFEIHQSLLGASHAKNSLVDNVARTPLVPVAVHDRSDGDDGHSDEHSRDAVQFEARKHGDDDGQGQERARNRAQKCVVLHHPESRQKPIPDPWTGALSVATSAATPQTRRLKAGQFDTPKMIEQRRIRTPITEPDAAHDADEHARNQLPANGIASVVLSSSKRYRARSGTGAAAS